MEIEYSLNESDLLELAHFQLEKSEAQALYIKRKRKAYFVGFALMALGFPLIDLPIFLTIIFSILAVVSYLAYPTFSKWRVSKKLPEIVQKKIKQTSLAPRRLIEDSNGLSQYSEQASSHVSWELINDIEVSPSHIFIAIEGTYSIVIPKSSIELEDYQNFKNSILGYHSDSKSLS